MIISNNLDTGRFNVQNGKIPPRPVRSLKQDSVNFSMKVHNPKASLKKFPQQLTDAVKNVMKGSSRIVEIFKYGKPVNVVLHN